MSPVVGLADLPSELQDNVCDALHVADRARLAMALPKACAALLKCTKNKRYERALGVLASAIRKKRVTKLSFMTRRHINRYVDPKDPTLAEMALHVPEVACMAEPRIKPIGDIVDAGELVERALALKPEDAAIAALIRHPIFSRHRSAILIDVALRNIPALWARLVKAAREHHPEGLDAEVKRHLKAMTGLPNVVKAALEVEGVLEAPMTLEELETLYVTAVNGMYDTEVALYVDRLIAARTRISCEPL